MRKKRANRAKFEMMLFAKQYNYDLHKWIMEWALWLLLCTKGYKLRPKAKLQCMFELYILRMLYILLFHLSILQGANHVASPPISQLKEHWQLKIQVCVWGQLRGDPPKGCPKPSLNMSCHVSMPCLLSWPLKEIVKRNHKVGLSFTIPSWCPPPLPNVDIPRNLGRMGGKLIIFLSRWKPKT